MLLSQEHANGCAQKAEEGMLNRLLGALLREPLLGKDWTVKHTSPEAAITKAYQEAYAEVIDWIEIGHQSFHQRLLLPIGRKGAFERYLFVCPAWMKRSNAWEPLERTEQLIDWLKETGLSLPDSVVQELLNSRDNLKLAYESMEQKRAWAQNQLLTVFSFHDRAPTDNTLSFIHILKQCKPFDELIYSESLAVEGHPLHPLTKTKWGLSELEVKRYAPEFEQSFALRAVLVRKDKVRWTQPKGGTDTELIAHDAEEIGRVLDSLGSMIPGATRKDYALFIVHPWQYDHILPQMFAEELARKDIVPIPYSMIGIATLSFRTIALMSGDGRHVKLPVAARATSAIRTVSPEITVNGPKLSALLRSIWENEGQSLGQAEFVEELAGAFYTDGTEKGSERSRHLAYLIRENPRRYMQTEELGFVAASLTSDTPLGDRPFIFDWMEVYYGTARLKLEHALDYIKQYALVLLPPLVRLLQHYGIALEAHMQNTMVCTIDGRVTKVLFRDLGGVRIHSKRLERNKGISLQEEGLSGASIFTDDMEEVYSKFIHAVLQNHLGDLVFCIARTLRVEESHLWKEIRSVLESSFDRKHPDFEMDWRAITRPLVRTKALFSMRCHDTAKAYLFTEVSNPLAGDAT